MSNRRKLSPPKLPNNSGLTSIYAITTVVGRLLSGERTRSASLARQFVPEGTELSGQGGFVQLTEFCAALELQLADTIHGLNGLELFEGLRRVSGRLWARSPIGTETAVRSVAELAVHRYGDWTRCRKPDEPLHSWRHSEVGSLAAIVVLAETYATALAVRRRIAKGQSVTVTSCDPLMYDAAHDEQLGRMIQLLDARSARSTNRLGTVGAQWPLDATTDDEPWILAAHLTKQAARDPRGLRGPIWHDPLVDAFYMETVESELEQLSMLDAGLDGFTLRELHFALDAASTAAHAARVDPPATLTLGGYMLALSLAWNLLETAVDQVRANAKSRFHEVTLAGAQRALDFLDSGKANRDLDQTLAQRPLRRIGDVMLYDALHVHIAGPLLWDIPLPDKQQDRRARSAEPIVHQLLAEFGHQPWGAGQKIRTGKDLLTDVDASVVIGSLLVVVDCYASPWSTDLDHGVHSVTKSRLDNLRAKLKKWHTKWETIAKLHPDKLPDGVDSVLPVVVSTRVEWINNDDDPLEWLSPEVPRYCTIEELLKLLRDGTDWTDHPAIIKTP
jgi:hypothetical protein